MGIKNKEFLFLSEQQFNSYRYDDINLKNINYNLNITLSLITNITFAGIVFYSLFYSTFSGNNFLIPLYNNNGDLFFFNTSDFLSNQFQANDISINSKISPHAEENILNNDKHIPKYQIDDITNMLDKVADKSDDSNSRNSFLQKISNTIKSKIFRTDKATKEYYSYMELPIIQEDIDSINFENYLEDCVIINNDNLNGWFNDNYDDIFNNEFDGVLLSNANISNT